MKHRRSQLQTGAKLIHSPRLGRSWRGTRIRDTIVLGLEAGGLVALVIFLEKVGRPGKNESWDALMFLLLVSVCSVMVMAGQLPRLGALGSAVRIGRLVVRELWVGLRLSCGIDFRPGRGAALPRFRWPAALNICLVAGAVGIYLLTTRFPHLPWTLRSHAPYVLYLLVAGALWSVLAVCDMGGLVLLYAVSRRMLSVHTTLPWGLRAPLALMGPVLAILPPVAIEYWLGARALLVLMAGWLIVPASVRLVAEPNYAYTIRHQRSGRAFELSMPSLWSSILLGLMVTVLLISVLAQGYSVHGHSDLADRLNVTDVLGHGFFWLGTLFCGYLAVATFWIFYVRRPNEDPSLDSAPVLWVPPPSLGPSLTAELLLNRSGFIVSRSPTQPRRQDIDLVLFDARPTVTLPPGIPGYGVQTAEWDSPPLLERVQRLERRSKRRRILAAFRELLAQVDAHPFRKGEGFFFAPQCWLIDGLQRDELDHEESFEWDQTGRQPSLPAYHQLFDIRLRRHLRGTFRSADVDVLFIEDGVDREAVLTAIEILLGHHEQGKTNPIQEHDFQGMVGTRVHVQEVGFDRGARPPHGLREPKYDDISRARILLIVRDRGPGHGGDDDPQPPEASEDSDRWLRESLRNLFPHSLTR